MRSSAPRRLSSIDVLRNTRSGLVYVLGNSWSLNQTPAQPLCSQFPTLGINRVLRTHSQVEMLILSDSDVLREELPRILQGRPRLLLCDKLAGVWMARGGGKGIEAYTWHVNQPHVRKGMPSRRRPPQPCHFARTGNTGTYAMEAAALMGFKEIRLLGIDFSFNGPQTHSWGNQTKHKGGATPRRRAKLIERDVRGFREVYNSLTSRGVRIVNESPEAGPLDEFIPRRGHHG